MGRDVVLVSSADETAFEVRRPARRARPGPPRRRPASATTASCRRATSSRSVELGRRLLGPELDDVRARARGTDGHGPRLLRQLPRARLRLQRLPRAATAATNVAVDLGPGHAGQPPAATSASTGSTPSCSATPTPTTGSTSPVCARRAEVPVRARGPARCTAPPRTGGLAALVTGELEPTFDWHGRQRRRRVRGRRAAVPRSTAPTTTSRRSPCASTTADGTSLAYSADTGPGGRSSALGRGLDLALCEATYGTDEEAAGIQHLIGRPGRATWRGRRVPSAWCSPTPGPGSDLAEASAPASGEAAYGAPVDDRHPPNERYTL